MENTESEYIRGVEHCHFIAPAAIMSCKSNYVAFVVNCEASAES
jgi:hypothetical protein